MNRNMRRGLGALIVFITSSGHYAGVSCFADAGNVVLCARRNLADNGVARILDTASGLGPNARSRFTGCFLRPIVVCGISPDRHGGHHPGGMIISLEFPRWEKVLNFLALIPYAMPGVVAAVGLIRLYSSGPLAISGTVWLLAAPISSWSCLICTKVCAEAYKRSKPVPCSKRRSCWAQTGGEPIVMSCCRTCCPALPYRCCSLLRCCG